VNREQADRVRGHKGFFAALDQSGGSTPKALREYGVSDGAYATDEEMFDLVHQMRSRILSSPAFTGSRVLGAILFQQTMDREAYGLPVTRYLWERKRIVPFLKVDLGLADATHGVQLMKPIKALDSLLRRAGEQHIFGTKMRSVIKNANTHGVNAIADQQFEYADRIATAGLVPILEPEVNIDSETKADAENLLHLALAERLDKWTHTTPLMLKLTLPTRRDLYSDLAADPRVLRVLALSGGYNRDRACKLLRHESSMIASFSRALLEGLNAGQSDDEFNRALDNSVAEIYAASIAN
jgi:fructose-bisphosphate aldolase class I